MREKTNTCWMTVQLMINVCVSCSSRKHRCWISWHRIQLRTTHFNDPAGTVIGIDVQASLHQKQFTSSMRETMLRATISCGSNRVVHDRKTRSLRPLAFQGEDWKVYVSEHACTCCRNSCAQPWSCPGHAVSLVICKAATVMYRKSFAHT